MTTFDSRYLPAVPAGFELGPSEPLSSGLRRITVEQFDKSLELLEGSDDLDRAVHETRKSIKRLRATLRLVVGEIGTKVYSAENALLRDTSRLLAPIRDGWVMVAAVGGIREEFGAHLAPGALSRLEESLVERHERMRRRALDDDMLFPTVVTTLRAARSRYAAWPVEGLELPGRRAIRDRFAAIEPGLRKTYARGRDEMDHAVRHPHEVHFHEWRKRVKYLRHQIEILEPLWPEVMDAHATALDRLGELLGDEHDLAVLIQLLSDVPTLCPDPTERAMVAALAQHRRAELQRAAITLGMRAYAETPDRFVERLGSYWQARGFERGG